MIPSIPSQRLCTFCGTGLSGRVFGCLAGSFRVIFVFVEMLPAGSAGSKERMGLWCLWVMWDAPNALHRSILEDLYHPWKWWNWGLFIYGIGFATVVLWVPSGSFWSSNMATRKTNGVNRKHIWKHWMPLDCLLEGTLYSNHHSL